MLTCETTSPACGCSSSSSRRSVIDYIDDGLRRRRRAPLASVGQPVRDDDGRLAQFSVDVREGVVRDIVFSASSCATLIAYCELVASEAVGLTPHEVESAVEPARVVALLNNIPPDKRAVSTLAVAAFFRALTAANQGDPR